MKQSKKTPSRKGLSDANLAEVLDSMLVLHEWMEQLILAAIHHAGTPVPAKKPLTRPKKH